MHRKREKRVLRKTNKFPVGNFFGGYSPQIPQHSLVLFIVQVVHISWLPLTWRSQTTINSNLNADKQYGLQWDHQLKHLDHHIVIELQALRTYVYGHLWLKAMICRRLLHLVQPPRGMKFRPVSGCGK